MKAAWPLFHFVTLLSFFLLPFCGEKAPTIVRVVLWVTYILWEDILVVCIQSSVYTNKRG